MNLPAAATLQLFDFTTERFAEDVVNERVVRSGRFGKEAGQQRDNGL